MNSGTFRLADLDEILPRKFQRRLDRLRSARNEIDMAKTCRRAGDEEIGEPLGGLGGEEGGVRIGEPLGLRADRFDDSGWPWPRQETAAPPLASR